ncbi:MAG: thiol-disulfide oxidoreductase DCC family protein [Bacteroidota bacterium]
MKELLEISKDHPILLFDGVCNLCNGFVQFVIERDPDGKFRFAALQSEEGKQLLKHFNLPVEDIFSVILIEDGQVYTRSTAALRMFKNMKGVYPMLYIFTIVPNTLRDTVYNFVARNRYRWFGQKDSCMIPTPELQRRFL